MIPAIFIPGRRDDLRNYTAAVYFAGGIPICSTDSADSALCSGLLLPGGGDIGEKLDGEEEKLIQSFVQRERPILGICRGMQALNVYWGGTLRDISGHQLPRGDMVHPTRAEGIMAQLLGEHPAVTSCHHQAADRLAEPLRPVQWAEDGVTEAVVHQELPVLGVQWHPERQSYALCREDAPDAREIFRYFVTQMKETP